MTSILSVPTIGWQCKLQINYAVYVIILTFNKLFTFNLNSFLVINSEFLNTQKFIMNSRMLIVHNFQKALNIGLYNKFGKIPSSTEIADKFNLRAYGTETISRETARKWKAGIVLPNPVNMQILIEWLNLNPEEFYSKNKDNLD